MKGLQSLLEPSPRPHKGCQPAPLQTNTEPKTRHVLFVLDENPVVWFVLLGLWALIEFLAPVGPGNSPTSSTTCRSSTNGRSWP